MLTSSGIARRETPDGTVELYFEDLGDPADPPVLLIMGLGAQLPMWPDGFCRAARRLRLPRHPFRPPRHRAVGQDARAARPGLDLPADRPLSAGQAESRAVHPGRHDPGCGGAAGPSPHQARACRRRIAGRHDRADPGRHRAGPGGVAGHHHVDHRQAVVRTARLAGHQAGVRRTGQGRVSRREAGRRGAQHRGVQRTKLPAARKRAPPTRAATRRPLHAIRPACCANSMRCWAPAACSATARRSRAPTVVLHGSADPMVRPRNGRAVAAAIPGARFVVVDGMGHDLPEPVWRPIVEMLTENFARAD